MVRSKLQVGVTGSRNNESFPKPSPWTALFSKQAHVVKQFFLLQICCFSIKITVHLWRPQRNENSDP